MAVIFKKRSREDYGVLGTEPAEKRFRIMFREQEQIESKPSRRLGSVLGSILSDVMKLIRYRAQLIKRNAVILLILIGGLAMTVLSLIILCSLALGQIVTVVLSVPAWAGYVVSTVLVGIVSLILALVLRGRLRLIV